MLIIYLIVYIYKNKFLRKKEDKRELFLHKLIR